MKTFPRITTSGPWAYQQVLQPPSPNLRVKASVLGTNTDTMQLSNLCGTLSGASSTFSGELKFRLPFLILASAVLQICLHLALILIHLQILAWPEASFLTTSLSDNHQTVVWACLTATRLVWQVWDCATGQWAYWSMPALLSLLAPSSHWCREQCPHPAAPWQTSKEPQFL